eukprot:1142532-Pelagomonas_calceolata.AAC.1
MIWAEILVKVSEAVIGDAVIGDGVNGVSYMLYADDLSCVLHCLLSCMETLALPEKEQFRYL